MSDPLTRALAALAQEGWGKFDHLGKSFDAQQQKQREAILVEAGVVADTFGTPAGEKCLDMLVRQVLMHNLIRPPQEGLTLEQQAIYAARRDGQNSVVALILNAIANVRGGDRPVKGEGT